MSARQNHSQCEKVTKKLENSRLHIPHTWTDIFTRDTGLPVVSITFLQMFKMRTFENKWRRFLKDQTTFLPPIPVSQSTLSKDWREQSKSIQDVCPKSHVAFLTLSGKNFCAIWWNSRGDFPHCHSSLIFRVLSRLVHVCGSYSRKTFSGLPKWMQYRLYNHPLSSSFHDPSTDSQGKGRWTLVMSLSKASIQVENSALYTINNPELKKN